MTDAEVRETVGHTRAEVPTLFENATGWPAIVGLAARVGPSRLEGHDLPGDLHDFFAEELWQFLDDRTRWRLAQLSLVAPISKAIAETLVGRDAPDCSNDNAGWLADARPQRGRDPPASRPLLAAEVRAVSGGPPSATVRSADQDPRDAAGSGIRRWDLHSMQIRPRLRPCLSSPLRVCLAVADCRRSSDGSKSRRDRRIDSPVLNLAAAEVSFRRAEYHSRRDARRAAASRPASTAIRVRSLNTAGKSARSNERSDVALELHRQARQLADDAPSLREALIGEILTSLDLGSGPALTCLFDLPVDEGSDWIAFDAPPSKARSRSRFGCASDAIARPTPIMPRS